MANKQKLIYIIDVFIISLFFLFSTFLLPLNVSTRAELAEIKLGWPFKFIIQDQTAYDVSLPAATHFSSPWENPTSILWPQFFLSFTAVFLVLLFILFLIVKLKKILFKMRN